MIFPLTEVEFFARTVADGGPVLVSTHVNPDPDAIGSSLAMLDILRRLGAAPRVVLANDVPPRCRILPGAHEILSYPRDAIDRGFPVGVILDSGNLDRIGSVQELLAADAILFNMDHHASNDRFGRVNWVDVGYSATGELLYDLCQQLGIHVDSPLATNIYAGMLTDTGRFRFTNTTSRVLRVAAELADAGVDVTRITNALYFDLPASDVRSMGAIYSTIELHGGGSISTLFARLEQLVEDPDPVVDTALSIRGVEVAALFSETVEGKARVSLRSREHVNVAQIAASFGGGGHDRAAGFRMKGTLESVRDRLIPVLIENLGAVDRKKVLSQL